MQRMWCHETLAGADEGLQRLYARLDEVGATADVVADLPAGIWDGLDVRGLNLGSLLAGDAAEGQRGSVQARCQLIEVCGHADPALTVALPGPSLSLTVIDRLGTPEQRRRMLAPFNDDRPVWGSFAITEPGHGSDAAHLAMTAMPAPGGYVLNGEKRFIGNAGRARYVIVFASVDLKKGQFGIRAFYVPLPSPSVTVDDSPTMTGMRAVRVARLTFTRCFVPDEDLLGNGGSIDLARSFAYAQLSFDAMRPCLSSLMIGGGLGLIDRLSAPNAGLVETTRRGIAAALDEWEGPVHSARLLALRAARLFDAGTSATAHASISKVNAQAVACGLVGRLARIPGIADHPEAARINRWWRDFQAFRVMEGTAEVHNVMIARARLAALSK